MDDAVRVLVDERDGEPMECLEEDEQRREQRVPAQDEGEGEREGRRATGDARRATRDARRATRESIEGVEEGEPRREASALMREVTHERGHSSEKRRSVGIGLWLGLSLWLWLGLGLPFKEALGGLRVGMSVAMSVAVTMGTAARAVGCDRVHVREHRDHRAEEVHDGVLQVDRHLLTARVGPGLGLGWLDGQAR